MFDPSQTAANLKRRGVPETKIPHKTGSLRDGLAVAGAGFLVFLVAGGLAIVPTIFTRQPPGIPLVILSGVVALAGLYLVFIGGHIMSNEAAEEAGGLIQRLARGAAKFRGNR